MTSDGRFWMSMLCCPREDLDSDTEADDGGLGGTQPVHETDITYASPAHNCVQDHEVLQHAAPCLPSLQLALDLHGPEPPLGLDNPEPALDRLSPEAQSRRLPDPQMEVLYEKRIQDLEDELNLMLRRNKELSGRVCELEDLMCPEVERTSWVESHPSDRFKEQLVKSLKEKRHQERRALKAEETLRDLKHQNAVLQKRLHQAGSRSPGQLSSPSLPPPPPLGSIGPMFSILKNATVKRAPPISEQPGEISGLANGDPVHRSPSAMSEVLEKIRHGVPLKPVTPPHKSSGPLAGGGDLDSAAGRAESRLDGMLAEQQEVAPELMLDGPSTLAVSPVPTCALPSETMEMGQTLGKGELSGRHTLEQENPCPVRELGELHECGRSTDDEGSTSSTLPVTSNHSTEEEDQGPEPYLCKSISRFEMVEGVCELAFTLGSLSRVATDQDSWNNGWVGSHRQSNRVDLAHALTTLGHEACVGETCAEQRTSVSRSVFVLPDPSPGETENAGHTEYLLPLDDKNSMGQHPSLLDASCETDWGLLPEANVFNHGAGTRPHTDAAGALAMKGGALPEEGGIDLGPVIFQRNGGSEPHGTEKTLIPSLDSIQEKIIGMAVDSLEDERDCKDGGSHEGGEELESSLIWYMASGESLDGISPPVYGDSQEPASFPNPEDLPFAQGLLAVTQLLGPVKEAELQHEFQQSMEMQIQEFDRTVAKVSMANELAVLKSPSLEGGEPNSTNKRSPCEAGRCEDVSEPASEVGFF